jgi:ferritin-like metal-binding protein YciE
MILQIKKDNSMANPKKNDAQDGRKNRTIPPKSTAAAELRELFIDELKDIIYAERALVKALPKMANNAEDANLKAVIGEHVAITEGQVDRLSKVFGLLGESDRGKKCDAMEGLILEGENILEETRPGPVRDAAIISASQKIEHYEIASYGTLVAFAKILGEDEVANLLIETLEEEKDADLRLTDAAYNTINLDAMEEGNE